MNKKELKSYLAPACEVLELESEVELLAGSPSTDPFDGSTAGTEEVE